MEKEAQQTQNSWLEFEAQNFRMYLAEMFYAECQDIEKCQEYEKVDRLADFYTFATQKGWSTLDWKKLHEEGKLSPKDYIRFSEHLEGLTEADYWRALGWSEKEIEKMIAARQ